MCLTLEAGTNAAYELGAQFLTIIAHPKMAVGRQSVDDDSTGPSIRQESAWLCGLTLRARAELGHEDDWGLLSTRLGYIRATWRKSQAKERAMQYRLRERLIAAHMAMPLLRALAGHQAPYPQILREEMKGAHPTVNELAEWMARDDRPWERYSGANMALRSGDREPSAIKSRFWRPTLPVLHLAAALVKQMDAYEQSDPDQAKAHPFHVGWLVTHRQSDIIARKLLDRAEQFEPLVGRLSEFGIKVPALVRVRLA